VSPMMRRVVLGAVTFRTAAGAATGHAIVGYLKSGESFDPDTSVWAAFLQGMREVGYTEGQNVSFEIQSATDQYAKSLVDRHVSVSVGGNVVAAHATKCTFRRRPASSANE